MVFVSIPRINKITTRIESGERDETTAGEFAYAQPLIDAYLKRGFHQKPKSRTEMEARGLSGGWNGETVSIVRLGETRLPSGKNDLAMMLMASRYLWTQAMKQFSTENKGLSQAEMDLISPRMANSSVVGLYQERGQTYFFSQIKGDGTLGAGQVHGAFAAGGIKPQDLSKENPFVQGSVRELFEETGASLDVSSVTYMMDEAEQGMVNFATAVRITDLKDTLEIFYKIAAGQPLKKVEAGGFALVPVTAEITTIDGNSGIEQVLCYVPKVNQKGIVVGLDEIREDRQLRGYCSGLLEYVRGNKDNLNHLLEKAGF